MRTSPRPWALADEDAADISIIGDDGFVVLHVGGIADDVGKADAAVIVQAVNAHDELVAALQATLAGLLNEHARDERVRALSLATAVLAKAGVK